MSIPQFDIKQPFENLGKPVDADFVRQNGSIFAWSESNFQYEYAWWLYVADDTPLTLAIKKQRPLPEGVTV